MYYKMESPEDFIRRTIKEHPDWKLETNDKAELVICNKLRELTKIKDKLKKKEVNVWSDIPNILDAAVIFQNSNLFEQYIYKMAIRKKNNDIEPTLREIQDVIDDVMELSKELFKEDYRISEDEFKKLHLAMLEYNSDIDAIKQIVGDKVYEAYFRDQHNYIYKYINTFPEIHREFQKKLSLID